MTLNMTGIQMKQTNPRETYNAMADRYTEHSNHGAYNAYYERPAMLQLLGDVKGLSILDVGCGDGTYSSILLENGAQEIFGFDISENMLALAQDKVGDRVQLHHASLEDTLDFIPNDHFDRIICPLMMHYVADWERAFIKLNTKLKSNGLLLFSTGHPMDDFRFSQSKNYFTTELIEEDWKSLNVIVKTYRRPLSEIFRSFHAAGFVLDQLVEPKPLASLEEINPTTYHRLSTLPAFICFRLRKQVFRD